MSLRAKADEVVAAGEAARGNFTPDGVPLRMYKYWLSRSNSHHASMIRAEIRRENFCHYWRVVAIWAPLYFLASITIVPVAKALAPVGDFIANLAPGFFDFIENVAKHFARPFIATGKAIARALRPVGDWISDNEGTLFKVFVRLAGIAVLVAIGFGTAEIWYLPLIILGALAVGALLIFGLVQLEEKVETNRQFEQQRRWNYYDQHGSYPPAPKRKPSKIKAFFRGIGDFLVLIAQIVRVNKWKICPLVEVK